MLGIRTRHRRAHVAAALALLVAGACEQKIPEPTPRSGPSPTLSAEIEWTFDGSKEGAGVPGFVVDTTNPRQGHARGKWAAVPEAAGGRSYALVSTNNRSNTFNVAYVPAHILQDLDLQVRVQPIAGKEDQGGGLVWRFIDINNYYVARWNPLEKNVRLYYVQDGKRRQIGELDEVQADPADWHTLRIRMQGQRIEMWFDSRPMEPVEDQTHKSPGKIGLWTKADATTKFDDLKLKSPP